MEVEEKNQGFDLTVTHRDEKTGLVTHRTPYILRVVAASDGGKTRLWERPAGSGNIFNRKGEPIGRWLKDEKTGKGKFVPGVEHAAFTPPETQDQKLSRAMTEKDAEIAALRAEVAAIKGEAKKAQR